MGDNALALARELGDRDLGALAEPGAEDATYFPVLERAGPLPRQLGVAAGGRRRRRRRAARGLVARPRGQSPPAPDARPAPCWRSSRWCGGPLAVQGLWALLVALRPGYASMLDPWRPGPYRLAAVALVAAVTLLWYALLRRRMEPMSLIVGGLVWLAALGGGARRLRARRLLPRGVAGAGRRGRRPGRGAHRRPGGPGRSPSWPRGRSPSSSSRRPSSLFFPALGLSSGAAPAFVADACSRVALLPAFELLFPDEDAGPTVGSAWAPPSCRWSRCVTAAACAVGGLLVDTFDATHPVPSQLVYALDTDAGTGVVGEHRGRTRAPYTAGYVGEPATSCRSTSRTSTATTCATGRGRRRRAARARGRRRSPTPSSATAARSPFG